MGATIQAIGRCAASIEEVTDTCLNGLVHLLSNRDQAVVAESVVVIKKLLQTQAGEHKEIITHMAKLVDSIEVPAAKAAILWVLGEYSERVSKIAPDVLRKMAKTFTAEEPQVKMQILNLAAKLCLTNPEQTKPLALYVFNLAKYDQNYDLRDRARFVRSFIFPPPGQENSDLVLSARKIFLATKPAPVTASKFKDRDIYQLGSLSHFLNARANGYQDLPEYPETAPDPSVRNVEPVKVDNPWSFDKLEAKEKAKKKNKKKAKKAQKGFYSEDEGSGTSDSSSSSSSSSSSGSDSGSSSGSGSEENDAQQIKKVVQKKNHPKLAVPGGVAKQQAVAKLNGNAASSKKPSKKKQESSSSSSSSGSGSSTESSESSEEEQISKKKKSKTKRAAAPANPKSNLDLLLDFGSDSAPPSIGTPMITPSLGGFLSPTTPGKSSSNGIESTTGILEASPVHVSTKASEILNKMSTGGLQVLVRYTRTPHLYSPAMVNLEVTLNNLGDSELTDLKIGSKKLAQGMALHEFPGMASLQKGESRTATLGINFNDSTQPAQFDLISSGRCHKVFIHLFYPCGLFPLHFFIIPLFDHLFFQLLSDTNFELGDN